MSTDQVARMQASELIAEHTDVSLRADGTVSYGFAFAVSMFLYFSKIGRQQLVDRSLEAAVYKHWEIHKFRYFQEAAWPQDLDTASAIVRVLHRREEVVAEYERFCSKCSMFGSRTTFVGGVPDWMPQGGERVHFDVVLNSIIADAHIGKADEARALFYSTIDRHDLKYFWYLQEWYVAALLMELSDLIGTPKPELMDGGGLTILGKTIEFNRSDKRVLDVKESVDMEDILVRHVVGGLECGAQDDEDVLQAQCTAPFHWTVGFRTLAYPSLARAMVGLS